MLNKLILTVFLFSLALLMPLSALALGQMSEPIIINNALRGEQIHQEIIAVNTEDKQITAAFSADGQIKDWVIFYKPNDLKNPVATSSIAVRSSLTMTAVFSIPAEIPNGEYTGVVSVTKVPDNAEQKDQSSASLALKIDREVTIKVTDQENISLEVSVIPKTYDLKTGESLSVRIIYDNRSNVSLMPSINFKIKNNEKTVYNVIYPYPEGETPVNPQAMHEIPALSIQTTDLAQGKYQAQLQFMRGDKVILEKSFGFSLGMNNPVSSANFIGLIQGKAVWLLALLVLIFLVIAGIFVKKNFKTKNGSVKKSNNAKK